MNKEGVIKAEQVILKVKDLKRSISFYEEVIGLRLRLREDQKAYLSSDGTEDLVVLKQLDNPEAAPAGSTGLFHFALLLPSREALADQWLHLKNHRRWMEGASDHSVSEAVYLEDPDGIGIEIYADREGVPVETMGTERLDIEGLQQQASGTPWKGLPANTVLGHIHLKVRDVSEAVEFYQNILGFDLMAKMGSDAAFMSTAGYHHHLGLNSWNSRNGQTPPDNSPGLDRAIVTVPDEKTLKGIKSRLLNDESVAADLSIPLDIKDPSGNRLQITVKK